MDDWSSEEKNGLPFFEMVLQDVWLTYNNLPINANAEANNATKIIANNA